MPGRTEASFSPWMRSTSPAKNLKIWPARAASPMPSGRVLPSSRDSSRPSSSFFARMVLPILSSRSCRSCSVVIDHFGKAARAAAIACSAWARSARAYSPTTSDRSDGFTFFAASGPSTQEPAM